LDGLQVICFFENFLFFKLHREKATQAGRLLAGAITDEKNVGCLPVTLIGFSMGARVIHACLQELHRQNILHRVHSAILIGSPVSCHKESWLKAREVVSDRLINVYCSSDWLLGFLFRYMEWGITVGFLFSTKNLLQISLKK
jgi:pimeloyl-ACP methyl ester carboxylesterase